MSSAMAAAHGRAEYPGKFVRVAAHDLARPSPNTHGRSLRYLEIGLVV